ncbi:MAG: MASE3 domain-containing protein [Armatimonadota bacterium]
MQRANVRIVGAYLPRRLRNRFFAATFLLCAFNLVAVGLFPHIFYRSVRPSEFLPLHIALEFMTMVAAFAIFIVGWYGYRQNRNAQNLFIAVVLFTVGLLDFAHTLSYKGMPFFLSESSTSKASTYWIATQLACSAGLLAGVFVRPSARLSPRLLLVAGLVLTAGVVWVVTVHSGWLPAMYIEGAGQSRAKIFLEWVIIVLFAAAGASYFATGERKESTMLLLLAMLIGIASELGFVLYSGPYDTFNLFGHVYRVAAFYLIFRSLFVSSFVQPYRELMQARDQVEESFSRIGAALASSLNLTDVLRLISELASNMLRGNHAAVMLVRGGELAVEAQTGTARHPERIPMAHTLAGRAIRTGETVVVGDLHSLPAHVADCRIPDGSSARSVVSAPILHGGQVLGVIEVYSPEPHAYGEREAHLLASFARQAAVAIRNSISYERDKAVAETLQRSLLPPPPKIAGLDIAVIYNPAEDAARIGGDLYDVFALSDDKVAIVIGDVCGHGLGAASTMAMTSHMIRGFLTYGLTPGMALKLTNSALCKTADEDRSPFVTVFAGILDLAKRELRYANAGHHMPVLLGPEAVVLEAQPDLPLGVEESWQYKMRVQDLSGSHGLLLYTDGLVEARRRGEMFDFSRLCDACRPALDLGASGLLESILSRVKEWAGAFRDDIAAVVVMY